MGSPFEAAESKNASPLATSAEGVVFDSAELLLDTVVSTRTRDVLATTALAGLATAGGKIALDCYTAPWLTTNPSTFQSAISETAPGWAKSYLANGSPSAAVVREATANISRLAPDVASLVKDHAAGAYFLPKEPSLAIRTAPAEYLANLARPELAIKPNATAAELLQYSRTQAATISGAAEREAVYASIGRLEGEMSLAQRPLLQVTKTGFLSGALQAAAVGGASYVMDYQLSKAAKAYYGQDSELGRVLEPTLTGASLTGVGCVLGSNIRTKAAYAAAGWLTGKALNYFSPHD